MRPCRKYRKPIALLAADSLEAAPVAALKSHLESCPMCRQYYSQISSIRDLARNTETESTIEMSAGFYRRLDSRLRATKPTSAIWRVYELCTQRLLIRVVAPVAIAIVIMTAWILTQSPSRPVQFVAPSSNQSVSPQTEDLAPTMANYYRVIDQSLDKFDSLVNQQALQGLPPAPIFTASARLD